MAFGKLKGEAEKVKIRLSQEESTNFHVANFCSELGKKIDVDFEITRLELEKIVSPYLERTIAMCKKVLKDEGLSPEDVEKIVLVGGQTFMPIVRRMLAKEIGIKLDTSADPIIVVAEGAAIVAHTLRRQDHPEETFEGFEIKLEAPETTLDTEPFVGGKILSFKKNNLPPAGSAIEISRADGSWASGKVPIDEQGVFSVNLFISKEPSRNEFNIELYNSSGEKMVTTRSSLSLPMSRRGRQL